jgi:hypothetical protein
MIFCTKYLNFLQNYKTFTLGALSILIFFSCGEFNYELKITNYGIRHELGSQCNLVNRLTCFRVSQIQTD